jgi:hypothetical protein
VNVAPRSGAVIGFYGALIAAFVVLAVRPSSGLGPLAPLFLAAVLLLFLGRYLSTHYTMDARRLGAIRFFGSRRVPFDEIRRIQLANLRDLGPVSFFGYWGWRGRMWSPLVGSFDSVHTVSDGVLVSAGRVPLFVSPRDPVAFARELSRRVRSFGGAVSLEGESFLA